MNKRIVSLVMAIMIIALFSLTSFANGNVGTVKVIAEYKVIGSVVELTYQLEGIGRAISYNFPVSYNSADVVPVKVTDKATAVSATIAALTSTEVTFLRTGSKELAWAMPSGTIDITKKYVDCSFGDTTASPAGQNSVTLDGSAPVKFVKFYFKVVGTVSASTFGAYTYTNTPKKQAKITDSDLNGGVGSVAGYVNANPVAPYILDTGVFVIRAAAAAGSAVTYNINGGTGTTPTDTTLYANAAPVAVNDGSDLTRDRYTFAGWTDNANGTGTVYKNGVTTYTMGAGAVTLFAKWTAIPVEQLPVISGDVTPTTSEEATYIDEVTKLSTTKSNHVVTFNCKVPASITSGDIGVVEFGISVGGVRFPAMTNANTFGNLDTNGGKYIIKIVDPNQKLKSKTYAVYNYFGTSTSATNNITVN